MSNEWKGNSRRLRGEDRLWPGWGGCTPVAVMVVVDGGQLRDVAVADARMDRKKGLLESIM